MWCKFDLKTVRFNNVHSCRFIPFFKFLWGIFEHLRMTTHYLTSGKWSYRSQRKIDARNFRPGEGLSFCSEEGFCFQNKLRRDAHCHGTIVLRPFVIAGTPGSRYRDEIQHDPQ